MSDSKWEMKLRFPKPGLYPALRQEAAAIEGEKMILKPGLLHV